MVTAPTRGLIQSGTGKVLVTGKASPNSRNDAIAQVRVNDVAATLSEDGSFSVSLQLQPGSTMIETVAQDVSGGTVTDTRAVQAGSLTPVGSNVSQALGTAISADAFTKISAAAGPVIKSIDINKLLAPLQPILSVGTADSCAFVALYIDSLAYSDIKLSVAPAGGGVNFAAEIDGLDVKSHVKYSIACVDGAQTVQVTTTQSTAAGLLQLAGSSAGFDVTAVDPVVQITGLNIQAPGLPQSIVDLLNSQLVEVISARVVEVLIGPVLNKAFGALSGPLDVTVLGRKVHFQAVPTTSAFTTAGALVGLDMKVMIDGGDKSPGFIFTPNQNPSLDTRGGLQLGLSDDLINELLAELHALGVLNLSLPQDAGSFDTAQAKLTMPPTISTDARDGALRLMLGDIITTFTSHGSPVAKASLNARVNIKITPSSSGTALGVQLGEPEVHVDVLDDIPNLSGLTSADLSTATEAVLRSQIESIGALLGTIPTPTITGVNYQTTALHSNDGYLVVSVNLQ